jgi:(p)ppGpp synthase/HD superfamily hydrolase
MALSQRFDEALVYAARVHAAQTRKGTEIPYLAHLLAVASLAIEHGASEDEAIAALLHDAIEDQGGAARRADILWRFGDTVAAIVDGCSDTDIDPKPPWRERKERYLGHLRVASPAVRFVAACDKLHNLRSLIADHAELGDALWERFNAPQAEQLWFFRALAAALEARPGAEEHPGHARVVAALASALAELEALVARLGGGS